MSEDEEMQRLAWWREKALHDEASLKGMGRREGIEIGEKKRAKEIAKKCYKKRWKSI